MGVNVEAKFFFARALDQKVCAMALIVYRLRRPYAKSQMKLIVLIGCKLQFYIYSNKFLAFPLL